MKYSIEDLDWIVSMIGCREHYAPPRAMHQLNKLRVFYTDVWWRWSQRLLLGGPHPAKRLAERFHADLPADRVVSYDIAGLFDLLAYQQVKRSNDGPFRFFSAQGRRFAKRVAHDIRRRGLDREPSVFFGFKAGALETLTMLHETAVVTVLGQFDAGFEHFAVLATEQSKWPGWETSHTAIPEATQQRWTDEWRLADVVFVNSPWAKHALTKQGVSPAKIAVGPLAYEGPVVARHPVRTTGPLRVLWVGNVNLVKGIQYLIDAAKALETGRFEFTVVGAVGITQKGLDTATSNLRFVGRVPRSQVAGYYRDADLFVFPTLSDGFGITQIEALSHGLPVIATPNCGDVVTHNVDGLIVSPGDSDALRNALDSLERNRDRLLAMSRAAPAKAKQFTLGNYARRIVAQVSSVIETTKS